MRKSLEQQYRRLLGWYPPRHRAIYQEEMVGVLLATAGPQRTRPSLAEAANLLAGGLRAWLRDVISSPAGRWLRDTGTILALLAPVAVLLMHASTVRAGWGPGVRPAGPLPEFGPSVWVPLLAWALVVLVALAGIRLAAAAAAWTAALLDVADWVVMHHRYPQYGWPSWGFALLIGLAATMLTVAPSARAAMWLVGWRRLVSAAIVAGYAAAWPFLAGMAAIPLWLTYIPEMGPGIRFYGWLACGILLLRLDVPPRRWVVRGLRLAR